MNQEQIDEYAEEIIRRLVHANLVSVNNQRHALSLVKLALETEKFKEQSAINKFFPAVKEKK